MQKIVECVPNFSEGRDRTVIGEITAAIESVQGVRLMDVDPGESTNRTVVTFIGEPEPVQEAAFRAARKAAELIDMTRHSGEHARFGALDVCPFIPVANVTMDECAEMARAVGQRIGEELGIPVYLYEKAAASAQRRNLADVRAGQYEGLRKKLARPEWKPDFGPAEFVPEFGAMVIGARKFLVAYNVNLNVTDKRWANRVAFDVREKGRTVEGPDGKKRRDGQEASDRHAPPTDRAAPGKPLHLLGRSGGGPSFAGAPPPDSQLPPASPSAGGFPG